MNANKYSIIYDGVNNPTRYIRNSYNNSAASRGFPETNTSASYGFLSMDDDGFTIYTTSSSSANTNEWIYFASK